MSEAYSIICDECRGSRVEPGSVLGYRACHVCAGAGRIVLKSDSGSSWGQFVLIVIVGAGFLIGLLELVSAFSR